jgi:DNA-binding GntR family transcriptional regulator
MTRLRFQELLQVRLNLETMLTRRAAEAITTGEIHALEGINAEMQDAVPADDLKRYLEANQRFHFSLYGVARSDVTFPIVESLWMQVGPFLNGVFTATGIRNARDNHTEILKALRRRDSVAAANAMASDLADAADVILARDEFVTAPPVGGVEPGANPRVERSRRRHKSREEMR